MSGHSRWSTIKRKKGAADAAKGKLYTKLVREITTAARLGGGIPSANPRLRAAMEAARAAGMPSENVERAIKKGTGDLEGQVIEECSYEGYGPAGVAMIVEAQTDNRNRTSADVRNVFTKNSGNLGAQGSVAWMFKQVGQFTFDGGRFGEDEVMEVALEAGADDVKTDGGVISVTCEVRAFGQVLEHFDKRNLKYQSAELTRVADTNTRIAGEDAAKLLRLIERLEDLDDVQKVYANFDIDDAELERLASAG